MRSFGLHELRTTDVAGATAFYGEVLGWQLRDGLFWRGDEIAGVLGELPAPARAAGAPAHWVGHVQVADVDETVRRLEAHGALRRGPPGGVVYLRDGQGAALAVRPPGPVRSSVVAWHELATTDRDAAWAAYHACFGWHELATVDLGPPVGEYLTFAYEAGGPAVGAMSNLARAPGIHTHWFLHFGVGDLDAAVARARAAGGVVVGEPLRLPSGERVAICDDAQGAAFAMRGQ